MVTELLRRVSRPWGCHPSTGPAAGALRQLLVEKNQVMNLTAITDPVEVAQKHMLDCAALLGRRILRAKGHRRGHRAGFPGLVLKLCQQETWTHPAGQPPETGGLAGGGVGPAGVQVTAIHGRAEELGKTPELRETLRHRHRPGGGEPADALRALPALRQGGGVFLAMKAEDCRDEVDASGRCIPCWEAGFRAAYTYRVPGTDLVAPVIRVEK